MQITFVGHSSIIVRTGNTAVLCDPWLNGRVFNDSWGLSPEPKLEAADLAGVDYLWISHEHPDHLHFPTLSAFPADFKSSATVIFQKNNSEKVPEALTKLGYRNFIAAEHNKSTPLGKNGDTFAVYQHRHLDSALIVRASDGSQIINVNDAELTEADCRIIRKTHGGFDVSFEQFSIAGFEGVVEDLRPLPKQIIRTMLDRHAWLAARATCPIASFMYFCRPDNAHLNQYVNTALDAFREFSDRGLHCHLMYPGVTRTLEEIIATPGDVSRFEQFYANPARPIDPLEQPMPFEKIAAAFESRVKNWHSKFPSMLVIRVGTLKVHCTDRNETYDLDFKKAALSRSEGPAFMEINSQPLWFAFAMPFGIQSLGVSGRYTLARRTTQWKLARIVSSLYNAEIFLRPRYLFSKRLFRWMIARSDGLSATVAQQFARFFSQ